MPLFWLLAGVLTTLATLFLLLPWLRRIPHIGPLPRVSWQVLAGSGLTLAAAVGLYLWLGRPELVALPSATSAARAVEPAPTAGAAAAMGKGGGSSMDSAIASLQARLAKGGGSADDWELLAKSYEFLGRPAEAAKARAHQLPSLPESAAPAAIMLPPAAPPALSPQSLKRMAEANAARRDKKWTLAASIYAELAASGQMNADSWADYADTAASLNNGKLAGAPQTYIARALALDPQHPKALWLEASADEESGQWSDAVAVWQKLAALLDPRSADGKIIAANLQQDITRAGGVQPAISAATGNAAVSGVVSLAADLRPRVPDSATLFIVAKSVDSPGIPVAVMRTAVNTWPVKFTLDDSQAMVSGRNLSSAGRVRVEARISGSGQAAPASGDLQGTSDIVRPSASEPLTIVIDRVLD